MHIRSATDLADPSMVVSWICLIHKSECVDFHTRHIRSPADLADPNMASSLNLPTNLESPIIIYSGWWGGTFKGTCNNSGTCDNSPATGVARSRGFLLIDAWIVDWRSVATPFCQKQTNKMSVSSIAYHDILSFASVHLHSRTFVPEPTWLMPSMVVSRICLVPKRELDTRHILPLPIWRMPNMVRKLNLPTNLIATFVQVAREHSTLSLRSSTVY
jgi:hypothetical protein